MFGSISNWITTTSSSINSSIPPVNMPNIQDIFGKNNIEVDQKTQISDTKNDVQKDVKSEIIENCETAGNVSSSQNISEKVLQQNTEIKNSINDFENSKPFKDNENKPGVINQLDLDAQKAYGQAKEIGNNIGSNISRDILKIF